MGLLDTLAARTACGVRATLRRCLPATKLASGARALAVAGFSASGLKRPIRDHALDPISRRGCRGRRWRGRRRSRPSRVRRSRGGSPAAPGRPRRRRVSEAVRVSCRPPAPPWAGVCAWRGSRSGRRCRRPSPCCRARSDRRSAASRPTRASRRENARAAGLEAEGAHRAASRIVKRSASDIGSSVKLRGDQRSRKIRSSDDRRLRPLLVVMVRLSWAAASGMKRRGLARPRRGGGRAGLSSHPPCPFSG